MKKGLNYTVTTIQLLLVAAMLSCSFLTSQGFFNDLITSKQYGLEIICLVTGMLFAITLLFQKQIQFTKIDLLVLLFAVWYIINELITSVNYTPLNQIVFNLLLWGLVYMFVRQNSENPLFFWGIAIIWMVVVLLQSSLGLLQLYGLESSHHGMFNITGTFHNPGPFSGFVVSGLPIALGVIGYTEVNGGGTEEHRGVCFKGLKLYITYSAIIKHSILALAWVTLAAILLVLPPAQSRAAWIAGLAGSFFVLASHPSLLSIRNTIKKKSSTIRKPLRILLLTVILLSITTAGFGLYIMKKGSADGRMLIWQVTGQLIKQSPVTGHGTGAFNALYMNEQADWFESGTATEAQAMVAGSPEAPFNEPLKLWLEKGFIAILLAVGILYFLFVTNKPTNQQPTTLNASRFSGLRYAALNSALSASFKGALISLLVFGLFSYPFDISSFVLQSIILVAILAGTSHQIVNIAGRKALLLTFPVAFTIILGSVYYSPLRQRHYQSMRTWQKADQLYNYRSYRPSVVAYEEAFPEFQFNGLFLQMYGKALNMDEQHQKSNEILALAQKHYSSYVIENTLGDNHKKLCNYDKSEAAYTKSTHMVPSMMLPKYLLAKLYNESGQNQKAKQKAEEILNTPVKVESSATREIMNEMKKIATQRKRGH